MCHEMRVAHTGYTLLRAHISVDRVQRKRKCSDMKNEWPGEQQRRSQIEIESVFIRSMCFVSFLEFRCSLVCRPGCGLSMMERDIDERRTRTVYVSDDDYRMSDAT